MEYLRGLIGLICLVGFVYLFSTNRSKIDWRLVGIGISLQILFGVLVKKVKFVRIGFDWVSNQFVTLLGFANDGTAFLFGDYLMNQDNVGFVFALKVLPTVIFFSTLTAGLYYLGVLQVLVKGIAWVMAKTMRLSGAESLSAAGNIFLGQTEAPLLVRPFIPKMTVSELMCLMTGGMATIAGGVLAGYVAFLGGEDPALRAQFASYLLSASIMNAPAAIVMAKIVMPELNRDQIDSSLNVNTETLGVNLVDALAKGAADGLKLAMNIGAMLLAFIAIIFAVNYLLSSFGDLVGLNTWVIQFTDGRFQSFSLEFILGQVFRVFAFLIGVDWSESALVGSLLGQKIVINEFVAYTGLAEFKSAGLLSDKSILIATYALCGFANFSSIAIQIGGIGGMAPSQQGTISKLGFRALLAATVATMMTATIAGALF